MGFCNRGKNLGFTRTPKFGVTPKGGGFTLIELLVVVAIIGILASVVLASLNTARAKARDAKRIAEIKQIQTALELYYFDNGSYPDSGSAWRSECASYGGYAPSDVIPGLVPSYISSLPADPTMNKIISASCYLYRSNTVDYALLDHAIQDTGFSYTSQPSFIDPTRDGGVNACLVDGAAIWARKISSSGGLCW